MKQSTTECKDCGGTNLVRLSSMDLKVCGNCGLEMSWHLEAGQAPLVGNNRQINKVVTEQV